jgi:hypothetical protein
MIKIAIINASTVLSDDTIRKTIPAFQTQIDRDFGPAWGVAASLRFVPTGGHPQPGEWWLAILDNSDQAGALGYHDLTNSGLPICKAFAGSDIAAKVSWTVTVSHELLEMLVDPNINLTVFEQGDIGARLYAYEVCDACEADQFAYAINGVLVSDFVLPSWFESFRKPGSTAFDFQKQINEPFALLPGGYIGVNDLARGIGWYQVTAERTNQKAFAPQGSRRQRRGVAPEARLPSDVDFGSPPQFAPADGPEVTLTVEAIEEPILR